jgi:hypothetical protein
MNGRGHLKGSEAVGGVQPHQSGRKPRTGCKSIPRTGRPKADLAGHVPAGSDDGIVGFGMRGQMLLSCVLTGELLV